MYTCVKLGPKYFYSFKQKTKLPKTKHTCTCTYKMYISSIVYSKFKELFKKDQAESVKLVKQLYLTNFL